MSFGGRAPPGPAGGAYSAPLGPIAALKLLRRSILGAYDDVDIRNQRTLLLTVICDRSKLLQSADYLKAYMTSINATPSDTCGRPARLLTVLQAGFVTRPQSSNHDIHRNRNECNAVLLE